MKDVRPFPFCFVLLLIVFSLSAFAGPGDLDSGFGTGGVVIETLGSDGNVLGSDLIIQPSGKIVIAGQYFSQTSGTSIALARYSTTGVLDPTFGTNGWTIENFGYSAITAEAAAAQPDDKIVVTGLTDRGHLDLYVARFTRDGKLDSIFGNGGIAIVDLGFAEQGIDIAVQPDGGIVVVGGTFSDGTTDDDVLVARLDKRGKLDQSFGSNGTIIEDFNGFDDWGTSLAIQADKKILVGAFAEVADSNHAFGLIRYTSNGNLDSTFGVGGKVTTDFGPNDDFGLAIRLQRDSKIVFSGYAGSFEALFAFARYYPNGTIDLTRTEDYPGSNFDASSGLAVGSNGRIILGGRTMRDIAVPSANSTMACFNGTTGALDSSFGDSGWVINGFGQDENIRTVELQSDNKIVSVGYAVQSDGRYFLVLARYIGCG